MEFQENDGVNQNACKGSVPPGEKLYFSLRQAHTRNLDQACGT